MTRIPSTSKGPRLVYLMGAEARFSANDAPDRLEDLCIAGDKERVEFAMQREVDRAHADEVHWLRCIGAL